ncbi:hypothetical protein Q5Y75_16015 [Ruegeria sp. 2205SS24-7]|uniref:hypothetical protein n=1 Tax=Ruegeria discodermiae TaxID=3064389 RepID=UPI0027420C7E|nr:hypothetical protein [Ruegeria sp. 2205SS24-7]MDP5218735.1 hypothetical protein [Ruegeria sp. 2205SS24-7]
MKLVPVSFAVALASLQAAFADPAVAPNSLFSNGILVNDLVFEGRMASGLFFDELPPGEPAADLQELAANPLGKIS